MIIFVVKHYSFHLLTVSMQQSRTENQLVLQRKIREKRHSRGCVGFSGGSVVKYLPANIGDIGLIPRLGKSPEGGNGSPLQYSCLENLMDRGAWQATVHGVGKGQTQPSMHTHNPPNNLKRQGLLFSFYSQGSVERMSHLFKVTWLVGGTRNQVKAE